MLTPAGSAARAFVVKQRDLLKIKNPDSPAALRAEDGTF
jgi:hypothetical protein